MNEKAIQTFRQKLNILYGNNLKQVILFGSQARGEATKNSDIDLLIITEKKLSPFQQEELVNLISYIAIEDDVLINFIEMLPSKFESEQSPLLLNIRREGMIL